MQPAITVAIIAAAISAVGWVVNYVLSSRSARERTRLDAQLSHVQRQLELLYGPLAFLLYEGRQTLSDLWEKLGPQSIFTEGRQLTNEELNLWLFWVDHDFMPRNVAIQELLATRTHLLADNKLPNSYIAFLNHHNSWRIQHARWKEEGVPYSWHSKVDWPREFEDEVLSTFEDLMGSHARLIGAVGRA